MSQNPNQPLESNPQLHSLIQQNEELKSLNESLEILEQAYRAMFLDAPIPYVIIDEASRILHENRIFRKSFRRQDYDFRYLSQIVTPASQDIFDWLLRQAATEDEAVNGQIAMEHSGRTHYYNVFVNRQLDQSLSFRVSLIDITESHHNMQQMEFLSFHDMLTETYNRFYLETEYRRINVRRCHPIGLILVDIDQLKAINDTKGHDIGDAALIAVAQAIKGVCRQDDIIVRLGGDEFAILIPNIQESNLLLLKQRLIKATARIQVEGANLKVHYGDALHSDATTQLDTLMHLAEKQLILDKQSRMET